MRQTALNTVFEIAKLNPRVIFIGSDLGTGTLEKMKNELPNQFLMEGISEQHIVGFAAGLAKEGFIPFVNTIANFFSRRALEQIILDVSLHNLPVKLLASGGGMVYAPLGPTHTATDDLAHMLSIPNLNVYSPCDALQMASLIKREAWVSSPAYIRFGKGGEPSISSEFKTNDEGSVSTLGSITAKKVVITTGVTTHPALSAIRESLMGEEVLLVHLTKLNLDHSELLDSILRDKVRIVVIEEHQEYGGLLTQVLHYCYKHSLSPSSLKSISLGHRFIRQYGSQSDHFRESGFTSENIINELKR